MYNVQNWNSWWPLLELREVINVKMVLKSNLIINKLVQTIDLIIITVKLLAGIIFIMLAKKRIYFWTQNTAIVANYMTVV